MNPRHAAPLGVVASILFLAGCQSYSPRPVRLDEHRAAWLARATDSPEVAVFARELATTDRADAPFDPSDGFTLPEAELVALVYNADLRIARLRAGVTAASKDHAGLWEDPVLAANFQRFIQSAMHPWMIMSTLGVTLPISGRLEVERRMAGSEHAASIARIYEQEWATRNQLRRKWAQWSAASQKVEVMKEYLTRLESLLGVVKNLEDAGELPHIDARFFRIEAATRRNELTAMESMQRETRLMVHQLMGIAPHASLNLVPGAALEAVPPEQLHERLATQSPMLTVALAEYQVAENSLELEIRKQVPDLMAGPGYGREEGMDQAVAMFELPIPLWNRNRQGIARATADREVARAMVETSLEKLESEFAQSEVSLASATAQRESLERDIVPLVDQQYHDSRRVAELGEVNTLSLLETLSRQQEARIALIDARLNETLAMLRLHELAGPPPLPAGAKP